METRPTLSGRRRKPARRRPIATLGAVAALALSALTITAQSVQAAGTPAVASAVAAVQKAWSYVPEYASAPTIDQGTVRNAVGQPVPGATVIVFPFLIGGGKPGSVLQSVARATSDSSGHFAIHLPASRDSLLINRRSNGYLNLHVIAFYPGGMANWFAPMRAGAHVAHINNLVLKHTATAGATRVAPNSPAVCVNETRTSIGNVPVIVGYKGSTAPSLAGAKFQYDSATTTTMGAGTSITSEFGGFSASGTTTQSAGGSFIWPNIVGAGNNYFVAAGLYYDQETVCGPTADRFWTLALNSLSTSMGTPGAEPVSAGHCATQGAGSADTYTKGSQQTFSAGANLTVKGFNIDLSSQDGWSKDSFLTFTTGSQSLPICGVNNWPNATNPGAGALTVHA